MAIFNGVLYFSTYKPLASNTAVCSDGFASLWGVDYRRADATGAPLAALVPQPGAAPILFQNGAPGSIVFGVTAALTPSCTATPTSGQDPYFGGYSQVTGVQPSQYRIMWQTGAGAGLTTGGNVRNDTGIVGMQNMTIASPGQSTRIDSWAAIVE
jgi:type IV pilus assembly protein PilY1